MKRIRCLIGLHDWVYDCYADMAGVSYHRDCAWCGQHEELSPYHPKGKCGPPPQKEDTNNER